MQYAAIFGRNPALSVAELVALGEFHSFRVSPLGTYAALLDDFDLAVADRFGSITKIIQLEDATFPSAEACIAAFAGKSFSKKVLFGISSYGRTPATPLTALARKYLSKRNIAHRYLAKHDGRSGRYPDGELSAVQVTHQKLLRKGFDWCIFEGAESFRAGKTVWAYDFAGFASRDYDKPVSDQVRGMLPPQLARTMVNLATRGEQRTVVDPFCGVGNLLLEASALGLPSVGSDLDPRAIRDAQRNLEWWKRHHRDAPSAELQTADATTLSTLPANSAIATEGYLGPLQKPTDSDEQTLDTAREIEQLLESFLIATGKAQAPGDRLVLTLPAWRLRGGTIHRLDIIDRLDKFGYTKVRPVPTGWSFSDLTGRETIDVARAKQRVIHELLIIKKR